MSALSCKILNPKKLKDLQIAANLILAGELVAFPTETVYGLAALSTNESAIKKIYSVKKRPHYNPLIVHASSKEETRNLYASPLPQPFFDGGGYWPGPLTLIYYKKEDVSPIITGGSNKVAVRVPSNKIAQKLIKLVGAPIVAPSANLSGRPSSTTVEHVIKTLGSKIKAILDGGLCKYGIESTIVDLTKNPAIILRRGVLELGNLNFIDGNNPDGSPGRLDRHYAPSISNIAWISTITDIADLPPNSGILYHSSHLFEKLQKTKLKPSAIKLLNSPYFYAKYLFSAFYEFEKLDINFLWIEQLPSGNAWDSIRDRIRRSLTSK